MRVTLLCRVLNSPFTHVLTLKNDFMEGDFLMSLLSSLDVVDIKSSWQFGLQYPYRKFWIQITIKSLYNKERFVLHKKNKIFFLNVV